ncbi:hypothetical protein T190611E02C_30163 [Tenacibaculum sp. 190524A05c]
MYNQVSIQHQLQKDRVYKTKKSELKLVPIFKLVSGFTF